MGFFTSPDGDISPLADGTDQNGVPYTDADPGTFGTPAGRLRLQALRPGLPERPCSANSPRPALRGIASGLGVAYNALANDLEGVNYSSIRRARSPGATAGCWCKPGLSNPSSARSLPNG